MRADQKNSGQARLRFERKRMWTGLLVIVGLAIILIFGLRRGAEDPPIPAGEATTPGYQDQEDAGNNGPSIQFARQTGLSCEFGIHLIAIAKVNFSNALIYCDID